MRSRNALSLAMAPQPLAQRIHLYGGRAAAIRFGRLCTLARLLNFYRDRSETAGDRDLAYAKMEAVGLALAIVPNY